jgi:hypothetical protein
VADEAPAHRPGASTAPLGGTETGREAVRVVPRGVVRFDSLGMLTFNRCTNDLCHSTPVTGGRGVAGACREAA